jgi:hypothetical protein
MSKADFNADEWSTVVEAPVLAGMRVVSADRGGTIRESLAMAKVYTEARGQQGDSELLDALASSPPAVDPQRLQAGGDITAQSSERLREALRLIGEKARQRMSSNTSASCCQPLRPPPKRTRKAASSASAASKSAPRNRPRSTKSGPPSSSSQPRRDSSRRRMAHPTGRLTHGTLVLETCGRRLRA